MHISNRFVIVCNIRIVIQMLKIYRSQYFKFDFWEEVDRTIFFRHPKFQKNFCRYCCIISIANYI